MSRLLKKLLRLKTPPLLKPPWKKLLRPLKPPTLLLRLLKLPTLLLRLPKLPTLLKLRLLNNLSVVRA